MVGAVFRVSFIGWNFDIYQGQFILDKTIDPYKDPYAACRPGDRKCANIAACIPGVNVIMGIGAILFGLFGDPELDCISPKDVWAFRVLNVTVGLLELTWIGAIVVHGIASIYFSLTRQPTQLQT